MSKIAFVGLHAHRVAGSIFDGLGYPQEHMDFAYENGMDALALTDHGNMNGLAWQVLHAKKMKAAGKDFKPSDSPFSANSSMIFCFAARGFLARQACAQTSGGHPSGRGDFISLFPNSSAG